MSTLPDYTALLADDLTRAVLRADGIEPREFQRTLEGAAARVRAAKAARGADLPGAAACWKAMSLGLASRCGA